MNKLYKLSSRNIINLIFIKELYVIWKKKINTIFIECANRWWKKRPVSTSVNVAAWRAKKSIDHVGRRPGFPNPVFILRSYHATESDVKQRILRFSEKKRAKELATSLQRGLFSFNRPLYPNVFHHSFYINHRNCRNIL